MLLWTMLTLMSSDDRFIAKELSRAELETMELFGPAYFDYMSSAFTAEVLKTIVMRCITF